MFTSRVGKHIRIGKFFETNINMKVLSDSSVLFFQLWASNLYDWLNFWSLLSTVQALILRSLLVQVIQSIFFCQTFFIWHFHILSIWPDIKTILIRSWTGIFLLTCLKKHLLWTKTGLSSRFLRLKLFSQNPVSDLRHLNSGMCMELGVQTSTTISRAGESLQTRSYNPKHQHLRFPRYLGIPFISPSSMNWTLCSLMSHPLTAAEFYTLVQVHTYIPEFLS